MEKGVFYSDTTWGILSYFLENPTKKTYPRELERTLKISSGTTSTICKKLWKLDILRSSKIAKSHMYKLNNENVFVKKLKTAWFLNWLMKYRKDFENKEFQAAVLYGSYSSGEFDKKSDLDILIITNIKKESVRNIFKNIEENFAGELSLTVFTIAQWKDLAEKNDRFYKEVISNHTLLYGGPILLG